MNMVLDGNPLEPRFVVWRCDHCRNGIEFDAVQLAGRKSCQTTCPHCGRDTSLQEPPPPPRLLPDEGWTLPPEPGGFIAETPAVVPPALETAADPAKELPEVRIPPMALEPREVAPPPPPPILPPVLPKPLKIRKPVPKITDVAPLPPADEPVKQPQPMVSPPVAIEPPTKQPEALAPQPVIEKESKPWAAPLEPSFKPLVEPVTPLSEPKEPLISPLPDLAPPPQVVAAVKQPPVIEPLAPPEPEAKAEPSQEVQPSSIAPANEPPTVPPGAAIPSVQIPIAPEPVAHAESDGKPAEGPVAPKPVPLVPKPIMVTLPPDPPLPGNMRGPVDVRWLTDLGVVYFKQHQFGEAFMCFSRAAQQGFPTAQFCLAVCYFNGHGVPQDEAAALPWLRQAAAQGDANAEFTLGLAYRLGRGIARNESLGMEWLQKAAAHGHAEAIQRVGGPSNVISPPDKMAPASVPPVLPAAPVPEKNPAKPAHDLQRIILGLFRKK